MTKPIVNHFLNPASIAVVGASRSPQKVGHQILTNLINGGYRGKIYPVNPNAHTILGLKCYPTLTHIPHPVEMAIIVTPAALVPAVLTECGQSRIQHAIIISAGFAESGLPGKTLQQEIAGIIHDYRLQVIGPNCLGVISPIYRVNASFGPNLPPAGHTMVISQSGALITGILDWAKYMKVGISHAVSFGNRVNLGEIEALEFAAADRQTHTILIYLESFQNAPAFFSLCSRITPKKPVIFLKGGQSSAGQTASASHTAALASDYCLTQSFARQTGVIVAPTMQQWLNLAAAFDYSPSAKAADLTIVTNAGGPGVLSTDEAVALGLDLPEPTQATKQALKHALPRINPHNPLDILGDATPNDYTQTLNILKRDPEVHNIITIITPQTTTKPTQTAEAIVNTAIHTKIPTYAVLIGGDKMSAARRVLEQHRLLHFNFPSEAIQITSAKSAYDSRKKLIPLYPAVKHSPVSANKRKALSRLLSTPPTLGTALDLLSSYQIRIPKSAVISTLEEIPEALQYVGTPAVMKTANMSLAHKGDVGGVKLNLMTALQARLAYRHLKSIYPEVVVQQTIAGGIELILGIKRDPQLGPFITVGLGGSLANAIADREYAFLPASKSYLAAILSQTKANRELIKKKLPIASVVETMEKFAALILDFDDIDEMEINPLIVTPQAAYAADIKITLKSHL